MKDSENQQPHFENNFNPNASDEGTGIVSLDEFLGGNSKPKKEEEEEDNSDAFKAIEKELETSTKKEGEEEVEPKKEETPKVSLEEEEKDSDEGEDKGEPKINYKSVISNIFGDTIDSIIQEDEEGNEVEVSFDELELNEELFTEIVNSKISEIKEASKDKISTESMSEFTKTLINIEKDGGNVQQALDLYNSYQNPLDSIDLDTEAGQEEAIYLRLKGENYADNDIDDLIDTYKSKEVLKQKAFVAKEELEAAVSDNLKSIAEQAKQSKAKQVEALKKYKTDLKEELSSFKIKDSFKNKILEAATKKDKDNNYELDNIYNSVRRDPKMIAELALFLLDKETYIKEMTKEAVTAEKKSTIRKVRLVPTKAKATSAKEKKGKDGDDNFVSMEEFLK